MGIYLNPGNMQFRTTLNADIYVDKTKSTILNMKSAYYDGMTDSRSLLCDCLMNVLGEICR